MMEKEFIPYEQALELKELGFDEVCMAGYDGDDNSLYVGYISNEGVQYNPQYYTKAPLFQQAFRWFRSQGYDNSVNTLTRFNHEYNILYSMKGITQDMFYTYEEAELACLKKLIEICHKNSNFVK